MVAGYDDDVLLAFGQLFELRGSDRVVHRFLYDFGLGLFGFEFMHLGANHGFQILLVNMQLLMGGVIRDFNCLHDSS